MPHQSFFRPFSGAFPHRSSKPATLNRGTEVARFDASAPRHAVSLFYRCFRSSMEQSAGLRTRRLRVRVPPKAPVFCMQCPRSPTAEAPVSETGGWGCESLRGYQFSDSIPPWQREKCAPLVKETMSVRRRPEEPLSPHQPRPRGPISRGNRLKIDELRVRLPPRPFFQKIHSTLLSLRFDPVGSTTNGTFNRTSAPASPAKRSVPLSRGMGSMPSEFRQFPKVLSPSSMQ